MVSHANVLHYVDYVTRRYAFTSNDRTSQTFDLTFDLSAHDMFVAWHNGACVCCPTQKQLIKPGAFINEARLTVWFSVPSTAVFMRRLGVLKPGMYPRLRLSLFCGEAFTCRDRSAVGAGSSELSDRESGWANRANHRLHRFDGMIRAHWPNPSRGSGQSVSHLTAWKQ